MSEYPDSNVTLERLNLQQQWDQQLEEDGIPDTMPPIFETAKQTEQAFYATVREMLFLARDEDIDADLLQEFLGNTSIEEIVVFALENHTTKLKFYAPALDALRAVYANLTLAPIDAIDIERMYEPHSPQEDSLTRVMARQAIDEALSTLNELEANVLRLRFGLIDDESRTLSGVGAILRVSPDRVRQIDTMARSRLRIHPQIMMLQEFQTRLPDVDRKSGSTIMHKESDEPIIIKTPENISSDEVKLMAINARSTVETSSVVVTRTESSGACVRNIPSAQRRVDEIIEQSHAEYKVLIGQLYKKQQTGKDYKEEYLRMTYLTSLMEQAQKSARMLSARYL